MIFWYLTDSEIEWRWITDSGFWRPPTYQPFVCILQQHTQADMQVIELGEGFCECPCQRKVSDHMTDATPIVAHWLSRFST
jgi:hypothetical protein